MATLTTLLAEEVLDEITVPLRNEKAKRWIFGFPKMTDWMRDDLPGLETGVLKATETPQEQLDNILYKWTSGKDIKYGRMFKDLMPGKDEVWELKTADLRVFGWIYQPRKFIAVFGDYADLYKSKKGNERYEVARSIVLMARNTLQLDEPKFATGKFDDLVCV